MRLRPRGLVRRLLAWYGRARRDLPWRGTVDPYRVWVAEVMLQQTRVATVAPRYRGFLDRFPDLRALADASEEEVLAAWSGLGYYQRARRLRAAARRIAAKHAGKWPRDFAAMRALPGVGEYTAAAVASIAFDQPRAALDGNAWRVLARLAGEERPVRGAVVRRALREVAESMTQVVPRGRRGRFTEALMELGATVCRPRAPRCGECPWSAACAACAAGNQEALPVTGPGTKTQAVELSVALARRGELVLLRRRSARASILPGFWELPAVEGPPDGLSRLGTPVRAGGRPLGVFSHCITNRRYRCRVFAAAAAPRTESGYRWMDRSRLDQRPVTTITRKALRLAGVRLDAGHSGHRSC